ncbi:MAG: hypothetical protein OXI16_13530 [Chloroflexota bacterium]|nr:hypothetical protein [Chloroflexota bacterium]
MRYDYLGTAVEGGVDRHRIRHYMTTSATCRCAGNYYRRGTCKHIKAVNHDCSCPLTLWMMHDEKGRVVVCAEAGCEYGAIRRQALENEGWSVMPELVAPKVLCHVCEAELLPNIGSSEDGRMRYCYGGEHWIEIQGMFAPMVVNADTEERVA